MCQTSNKRVWWAIAIIFSTLISVSSIGAGWAISDHGTLTAHSERIMATDKRVNDLMGGVTDRLSRIEARQIRIEDKLDFVANGKK